MSHHGHMPEEPQQIPQWLRDTLRRTEGEFPNGRLNPRDEGAVSVAIGHQGETVVMQFPKNLNWIGFTADQAIDIANSLIEHARKAGSQKPLTVRVG